MHKETCLVCAQFRFDTETGVNHIILYYAVFSLRDVLTIEPNGLLMKKYQRINTRGQ